MPASIDTLLARLIGSLDTKRRAIEEAIAALRILRERADLIPTEIVRQHLQEIISQGDKPNTSQERSLFSNQEPTCEAIEAEEEARHEEAREEEARTYYRRIVGYFLEVKNKPSTTSEIRESTKLTRSALSAVLYRTHAQCFLRSIRPGYERMTLWRLEPDTFETARRHQGHTARLCPNPASNKSQGMPHNAEKTDNVSYTGAILA